MIDIIYLHVVLTTENGPSHHRVRSKRGTQFRIWTNYHLKEYMFKVIVMADERMWSEKSNVIPEEIHDGLYISFYVAGRAWFL